MTRLFTLILIFVACSICAQNFQSPNARSYIEPPQILSNFGMISPYDNNLSYVPIEESPPLLPNLDLLIQVVRDSKELGVPEYTPVEGLYQFTVGNDIYYLSQDGRYLIEGNMLDLQAQNNLTEEKRNHIRAQILKTIPDEDFIIFPSEQSNAGQVTVFSDFDCPYCRVIYDNIGAYNRYGIDIRLAAFPRAGMSSMSYEQMIHIWCAPNRQDALARMHQGLEITPNHCQAPIEKEYLIALRIGINTAPSFVLQDGTLITGYVSPENLARILHSKNTKNVGVDETKF